MRVAAGGRGGGCVLGQHPCLGNALPTGMGRVRGSTASTLGRRARGRSRAPRPGERVGQRKVPTSEQASATKQPKPKGAQQTPVGSSQKGDSDVLQVTIMGSLLHTQEA